MVKGQTGDKDNTKSKIGMKKWRDEKKKRLDWIKKKGNDGEIGKGGK